MKQRNDLDDLDDAPSSPADSNHPIPEAINDNLSRGDDSDSFTSPPPYGDTEGEIVLTTQDGLHTHTSVAYDGRINIDIDSKSRRLSKLLRPALASQAQLDNENPPEFLTLSGLPSGNPLPGLNIVIQLVGSRGDIQPFVALGLELDAFGHRVRIATHPTFKSLVENAGLEFFSIGGDPAELMAFMVKNPGLLPGVDSVLKGEVQRRRKSLLVMLDGCWRSCIEAGDGLNQQASTNGGKCRDPRPFVADAIISNPPAFAHIHCAEKLGVPLHLVFTMPWSPTQAFSHPLANIKSSNGDASLNNYLSYVLVEMMIWQGVGSVINKFRRKTLGLDSIDSTWAPSIVTRLKIPYTYCWSPSLISRPKDWGMHISVAGFCFLPLGLSYVPTPELVSFLENGPPPVYIGFGSVVVENPKALMALILLAVELAGVRAVIAKGWADLAEDSLPPSVLIIDNCPHDWLFKHVSCVVHHGGAGTTSAGIAAGKPTVVVPFFGDQPFWGDMIARAGAGPRPLPFKTLTATSLAAAITAALDGNVSAHAHRLGAKIANEKGSESAAKSFHDRLPLGMMACSVIPRRAAVWRLRKSEIQLSALAATILRKEGLVAFKQLELYRSCEYDLNHGPWEPISGGLLAVTSLFYETFKGIGEMGSDFGRVHTNIQSLAATRGTQPSLRYSSSSGDPTPSRPPAEGSRIIGTGLVKGTSRIVKAAVRSPMTFTLAMAQGAHNLPRTWGDTTVRPQDKITGVGSGLVAAAKELTLGTYDGISGLFLQPIIGARDEGALGAIKGLGKGIAGTPVKFFAAMNGTVGYSLKGVEVEITKALRGLKGDPVMSARVAQGEWEFLEASEEEKREVVAGWHEHVVPLLNRTGKRDKGKAKVDRI